MSCEVIVDTAIKELEAEKKRKEWEKEKNHLIEKSRGYDYSSNIPKFIKLRQFRGELYYGRYGTSDWYDEKNGIYIHTFEIAPVAIVAIFTPFERFDVEEMIYERDYSFFEGDWSGEMGFAPENVRWSFGGDEMLPYQIFGMFFYNVNLKQAII